MTCNASRSALDLGLLKLPSDQDSLGSQGDDRGETEMGSRWNAEATASLAAAFHSVRIG